LHEKSPRCGLSFVVGGLKVLGVLLTDFYTKAVFAKKLLSKEGFWQKKF